MSRQATAGLCIYFKRLVSTRRYRSWELFEQERRVSRESTSVREGAPLPLPGRVQDPVRHGTQQHHARGEQQRAGGAQTQDNDDEHQGHDQHGAGAAEPDADAEGPGDVRPTSPQLQEGQELDHLSVAVQQVQHVDHLQDNQQADRIIKQNKLHYVCMYE